MKGFSIALLVLTALEANQVSAFTPTSFQNFGLRQMAQTRSMTVDMATGSDVGIPYDAAAALAYDDWCKTNKKTFDAARYEIFKGNYEAITIMNVAAKKKARDEGTEGPSLLALNEYADCNAEEYEAAMSGEAPSSSKGILEKAIENAESQMTASSALQDAADALSEEEEVGY
jgi:hypothetical protein